MVTREVDAPMAVGGSPAVARYRLRVALREARESKGLTQRQVAESLDWSLSKVARIELGEVSVSTTDVRALLELLDITEPARTQELLEEARAARKRSWWERPEYREHLTPAMIETFQFEAEATEIRSFQPTLLPGVMQTRDYASAIVGLWHDYLSDADRVVRVDVRRRRHEQLFSRPDPPLYMLALDESVLMRTIGGPQVMSDQLYELLRIANNGWVMVRVAPLDHTTGYAALGLFTVYTIEENNVLLYREGLEADETIYSPDSVSRHRKRFDQIWEQSMTTEASIRLIEARAATLRAEADRR
jgi:transcriptional regulator with XRE-family HTH domain